MTELPAITTVLPGVKSQALIARDKKVVSPSLTRDYPFTMKRGRGAWVWDADDNKFLDFTCGIGVTNVGHSHPKVTAAIKAQVDEFLHMAGTDYYYEGQVALAEKLGTCAWDKPSIAAAIKEVLTATGLKMPQLAMSVRVLVLGTPQTPSLDAVLALCDRQTAIERLGQI